MEPLVVTPILRIPLVSSLAGHLSDFCYGPARRFFIHFLVKSRSPVRLLVVCRGILWLVGESYGVHTIGDLCSLLMVAHDAKYDMCRPSLLLSHTNLQDVKRLLRSLASCLIGNAVVLVEKKTEATHAILRLRYIAHEIVSHMPYSTCDVLSCDIFSARWFFYF